MWLRMWMRVVIVLLMLSLQSVWAAGFQIESFSPQGTVKGVRQVTARFTAPMIPFGDPRLPEPFDIDCPEKGTARWVDAENWAYDFDRDLPAGVSCRFVLKAGLKALDGSAPNGTLAFTFNTGGPSVLRTEPDEGSQIEERQIFILGLDATVRKDSVLEHAWCSAQGINEKIGVRFIEGAMRQRILAASQNTLGGMLQVLFKSRDHAAIATFSVKEKGTPFEQALKANDDRIVVLQCARRLPAKSDVSLVWGAGIATQSGITTDQDQALAFEVRENFRAKFNCERVNKHSNCIPMLPMTLDFTAPVPARFAKQITLTGAGKTWHAVFSKDDSNAVNSVNFSGPFPEHATFKLTLPEAIRDDAGRPLYNRKRFPLQVKTDFAPPLAKFPAEFGIIELNAGATLPVTVRNLEPALAVTKIQAEQDIPGKTLRVSDNPKDILYWLKLVRKNANDEWEYDEDKGRSVPVVRSGDQPTRFHLPKPNGAKAFEIIGIPLEQPGLHIVELASPKLGAALLGEKKPYYVRTAALVTNLSVHFKQGRESSLVWVTSLDKGEPVANAAVDVRDCGGTSYWKGKTDKDGIANIETALPSLDELPICFEYNRSYFVTARLGKDNSFVFSDWNEGINRWRFNLPDGSYNGPILTTTVFDRTLLRAGETVHMKHFYRRHTRSGFALPAADSLPPLLRITHQGSEQKYEMPLKWNADDTAESVWTVPKDAKSGSYTVEMVTSKGQNSDSRMSGSFRVEAFRVPTMKAVLKPLGTPLINVDSAELDMQLNYLSGGGAGGLPVKLRGLVEPRTVSFADYPDFTFANGSVKEGLQAEASNQWQFGDDENDDDDAPAINTAVSGSRPLALRNLVLDKNGAIRATLDKLPRSDAPQDVTAELEYRDPNGETLAASSHFTLWPSRIVLGIKPDAWAASKEHLKFHVLALDTAGKPLAGVPVSVDMLQQKSYSHRKRLIGGFYAYEHKSEIKRLADICQGVTDAKGYVHCDTHSDTDGNLILRAHATDDAGNASWAHREIWVAGKDDWWFDASNDDRMDVLPEKPRYEPGDTATFQVRMPFREATALVTVEREGVIDSFVQHISGKEAVVKLPIKSSYAPNVFVSVLAVRGRMDDVQPGALVDLGKPAFKLGIGQINVGWRAHELKVAVHADRDEYKIRDKAHVKIKVIRADGSTLPAGAEVALAAVDEGLLELMPNDSWKLLETMMSTRGLEVDTATAQMQVVGKRHFGRKAVPHGGGGGHQAARELFETLLKWQARVKLDANGEAEVDVPLNDALSSFRIVAIAHAGAGLFGTGSTSVHTTQDVILLSGLPPMVREQDSYRAGFTVRNASKGTLTLKVQAKLTQSRSGSTPLAVKPDLAPQTVTLAPGAAQEVAWNVTAPLDADNLRWEVEARTPSGDAGDKLAISQKVVPAVPVRTYQATLLQLDQPFALAVAKPADALPERGGVVLHMQSRLADELAGVQDYMASYPYTCLEQQVSQAVALRDQKRWDRVMDSLPAYLDNDGMAKYFPMMQEGSDTLTAYLMAIANEAGWTIPNTSLERMNKALNGFVTGRVRRYSALPTADLAIRKIAALEALSRYQEVGDEMTQSFSIEPNLWPTSAVLDWYDLLKHASGLAERDKRMQEAQGIIRSRLNFQGTTMGFATERSDYLWWLMISGDVNANRAILDLLDNPQWQKDMPRLVRGSIGRQHKGRWQTTVANAWGVLALEKFSQRFEAVPVTGKTVASLSGQQDKTLDWSQHAKGGDLAFNWPATSQTLHAVQNGTGKPWLTVESRAAIPLKQPLSSGFHVVRTVTALEQKVKGRWSRGDVLRVHLDLEAQSDMSWVVVDDPIPAGASVLGTGLGRDSAIFAKGEKKRGWVWPAFEERTFEAFRAYYAFVPKGSWSVEYTVRLNNSGHFELPATRVEAMYAPEMFGEIPNQDMKIQE
ncbi:alpha-2-macroglobulin family protein [Sulfuriferula nivalis]|uniref:Peptidase inhibitor n=1 Tax=Sulfuriferula nivalis TaxID=2675298 RepID=A0A809S3I0_9PROT|nr:MG2 domain-containing protein [Sulfuriferula nivalis]BBP01338.1 peptidase inhibitor [Sulfuriferula nivalis]